MNIIIKKGVINMYEELENNGLWIAVLFLLGSFLLGVIVHHLIDNNKLEVVNGCLEYQNVTYCEED